MSWNSLFPRTFKPWELQWPINNVTDLTDVWLLATIGISILALLWAFYRTGEAVTKTGRYLFLQDVELQSAKRGVGAWAKTNWDLLPDEMQAERQENDELAMAAGNAKLAPGAKINPNTAPRDELMLLPESARSPRTASFKHVRSEKPRISST